MPTSSFQSVGNRMIGPKEENARRRCSGKPGYKRPAKLRAVRRSRCNLKQRGTLTVLNGITETRVHDPEPGPREASL